MTPIPTRQRRVSQGGGSYYLTYHRFARRDQVIACHPAIRTFLAAKRRFDPLGVFQSDWYRHLIALLSGELPS